MNDRQVYYKDDFIFIAPSHDIKKKYDVYTADMKYLASFGARNMSQFKDSIGYYSYLDNNDVKRRANYHKRHKNDYNVIPYPSYFSNKYLW
jgi:hypothetical protein